MIIHNPCSVCVLWHSPIPFSHIFPFFFTKLLLTMAFGTHAMRAGINQKAFRLMKLTVKLKPFGMALSTSFKDEIDLNDTIELFKGYQEPRGRKR